MYIYTNIPIPFELEDKDEYTCTQDEYIYTSDGIYKKYKKHFYELDLCEDHEIISVDDNEFLIQKTPHVLNKHKLITTIPYKHHYVKKRRMSYLVDEELMFVKELDNDVFSKHYFISNNSDYTLLDKISSFLKNNVCS